MEVKIQDSSPPENEILVTCSPEEWEEYQKEVLKDLQEDADLEGFRKGNAPLDVIRKKVGEEAVQGKAAQLAVEESYTQALQQKDVDPLSQPKIQVQKMSQGGEFQYKARFAVEPEVKLGQYKGFEVEAETDSDQEISDEEVQDSLQHLQKRRSNVEEVEREAEEGDRVEIDFTARHKDVKVEGGDSKNHPLVLGEGQFPEDFEEELVGMEKGDEDEFSINFPDDFSRSEFAGKKIDFEVKMKKVQSIDLPELNDEFAQSLGDFDNLEELKEQLREGIKEEKEDKQEEGIRQKLLNKAAENAEVEVSPLLVERELDSMMEQFNSEVQSMGLSMDDYLDQLGKDKEDLRENWKPSAKKRLQARFVLDKIAEKEDVTVDEDEIEQEAEQQMKNVNPQRAQEELDVEEMKAYTEKKLRDEKVLELLKKEAEIE